MAYLSPFYGKNVIPLVIIAASAAALSVITYYYSSSAANAISDISSNDIRTNAASRAHDLSLILTNGLDSVTTNLQILSNSPSVHNDDDDARMLFNVAQDSTRQLTYSYMWLDSEGRIKWVTDENPTDYIGRDRSYREYFIIPQSTLRPHFSDIIMASDEVPRLYLSNPAVDRRGGADEFEGVIVAAIGLDTLGNLLQQDSPSELLRSRVQLVDNSGTILYAADPLLIGKNIIDDRESILAAGLASAPRLDAMVNELQRLEPGPRTVDYTNIDGENTLASEPVIVDGRKIWTVYVMAPHTLISDVRVLFDQQNIFSTLMVIVIGALALGIASLIIGSNKRLELVVGSRTAELKRANESLEESNKKLAAVNKQLGLANEQLQVHDKMQREFINVASHEMKTPTQAILLHSDIVKKKPQNAESINAIIRNAERLQRLTNNILDVTRIESQAMRLNMEKFNINDIISAIVADYTAQLKNNKNIEIAFKPDQHAIIIQADKARLTQVISNLLGNAVEFTKEGTITVAVELKDSKASVSVSDSGPGIDPEIMPRLFSKFVTKSEKGTGLGLFISKSIVEAHGGTIWAENTGRGATLTFVMPAAS